MRLPTKMGSIKGFVCFTAGCAFKSTYCNAPRLCQVTSNTRFRMRNMTPHYIPLTIGKLLVVTYIACRSVIYA